jgi:hypothetical protein
MDNPIYGDENSTLQKVIFYLSVAVVAIISIVSIALLIVFTFIKDGHWPHILFAVAIVAIMIPGIIMLWFHKRDDGTMDSKLKIVTIAIWLVVIFVSIVGICYVFGLTFPGQKCNKMGSHDHLYRYKDNKCFKPVYCMERVYGCVYWDSDLNSHCGLYNTTTQLCIPG